MPSTKDELRTNEDHYGPRPYHCGRVGVQGVVDPDCKPADGHGLGNGFAPLNGERAVYGLTRMRSKPHTNG